MAISPTPSQKLATVTLLYELSLAIGTGLSLEENVKHFLKTLARKQKLNYVALWLKNTEQDKQYDLYFASPRTKALAKSIDHRHYLSKQLQQKAIITVHAKQAAFKKIVQEKEITQGSYAVFKIRELGFLKMHSSKISGGFDPIVLQQLQEVFDKFANSIEASLYYDQLLEEQKERQQIQEALSKSEEKYRMVVENISEGILLSDLNGKITFANDKIVELSGYSKAEIIGHSTASIPFYKDKEQIDQVVSYIINGDKSKSTELTLEHEKKQKGKKWWCHLKISPFYDRHGKMVGMIAVIADISAAIHSEKVLRESEEKFRSLYEESPIGVAIHEKGTSQLTVNNKFCEMLGYTQKEFNQLSINDISPPEDEQILLDKIKLLDKNKLSVIKMKKRYICKDGSIAWGNLHLIPFKNKQENTITHIATVEDITEKEKAEEALKRSEEKFRTFFEQSPLGVIVVDILKDGNVFQPNPEICKMLGYTEEELKQLTRKDITHPDDLNKNKADFKKLMAGKVKSISYELRYLAKSGKIIWVNTTISHPFSVLNHRSSLIILVEDISKKKAAEEALIESESKLIEAQRLAKTGSWEYDLRTDSVKWSDETFRIFGMSPKTKEPTFREYIQRVLPEELPKLMKGINNTIRKGVSNRVELRQLTIKNKIIDTICHGKALFEQGEIVKIFGTIQDITETKLTENQLRVTNEKYVDLFENMYDALLMTDEKGRFIDGNKAALKLLEFKSKKELCNNYIPSIVYPEDREKSARYLKKLLKDGYYSNYQGRIITQSGQVKYLQVSSNAIYKNGKFAGSRDIARDITALKEAEKKREELFSELEKANQELKDFAYIVSHDLKAPLRGISSLAQWIAEDYAVHFDEEGMVKMRLLQGRVDRMHNFIEGILAYSRVGRISNPKESFSLHHLIQNIIDYLDPPARVQIKLKTKLPQFYGEKIKIQQLFQNLISNAIKYNDKKKCKITIKHKSTNTHYHFSVKDNGPGIEKKHHQRIFEIFQTLHPRDDIESTGIGLSIVKRVVLLNDGHISIKSKLGAYTVFEFSLKKTTV